MSIEKPESRKNDKEPEVGKSKHAKIPYEKWEEAINFVNKLWHEQGKENIKRGETSLDENLEPLLICLVAYGFSPSTSCGGHMTDEKTVRRHPNGAFYSPQVPYINMGTADAMKNHEDYYRLFQLLEEFYDERSEILQEYRLVLRKPYISHDQIDWKRFSGTLTFGWPKGKIIHDYSNKEINEIIQKEQEEIDDFVKFLKRTGMGK
jgi:hypothetical protein